MIRKNRTMLFCILLAAVLLTEVVCWLNNGKGMPYYSDDATFESLSPSYINGYKVEGGSYSPTGGERRIGFYSDPGMKTESLCISFARPVETGTRVQIFFAGEGQSLAERRSVVLLAEENASDVIADLPGGYYQLLQLDIDGDFALDSVRISGTDPKYVKGRTDYFQLAFELLVIVWLARFLLFRFTKKHQDIRPSLAAFLDPGRIELSASEKWYIFFCFTLGFVWACVFHDCPGPDETMRYDIPLYIFQNGTLPYGWEPELIHPIWGNSYGYQIMLPYLISALIMRIVSFYVSASFPMIIAARMTSVLAYTGTVYFAVRIGKKAFSGDFRWLFVFIMTLTPQVVFLGSYVNLDSFELFTVMMIIDCWLDCMTFGWDRRCCLRMGLAAGLCLLSYQFAYSFLLGSVLLYGIWYWKNRREISAGLFLRRGLLIIGVALLISGWYFIRNAILYDGDFLALHASRPVAEQLAQPEYKPSLKFTYQKAGYSIPQMLLSTKWIKSTLLSLVSTLGGMDVFAHDWVYIGFILLFALGLVSGTVELFAAKSRDAAASNRLAVFAAVAFSVLVTAAISVYFSWAVDYQPQGRYIISALTLIAWLTTAGFQGVVRRDHSHDRRIAMHAADMVKVAACFLGAALMEAFLHCVVLYL